MPGSSVLIDSDGLPLVSRNELKKLQWIAANARINGSVRLRATSHVSGRLIGTQLIERVLGTANSYYVTALGNRLLDARQV